MSVAPLLRASAVCGTIPSEPREAGGYERKLGIIIFGRGPDRPAALRAAGRRVFPSQPHRLRAIVAAAAAIGLVHALVFAGDAVAALWWGMLLAAAMSLLGRRLYRNAKVRFTADEEKMADGLLAGLSPNRARHFLDQGFWLTGRAGDVLTREEEAVSHLFYLAAGEARVTSHGRQVGLCRAGDVIGEVTVLSGDQASATVTLAGPARFWCAPANALRPYLAAHEDIRHALEHGFTTSLKSKLRASNQRIADAAEAAA